MSGSQIIAEETDTYIIVYLYDAAGSPIGMQYREFTYAAGVWDSYFFEKNMLGDVVAVYDANGTKLMYYTYDAWGNTTVSYLNNGASTSATRNPFRYRGYYFDADLNLYYLNSRYYDHNLGRFISPDNEAVITATPTALTDKNLYAYCDNNPVSRYDYGGAFWEEIDLDGYSMSLEGAGGGPGFGGFGLGSSYRAYQIRSNVASYNARWGGYGYGGGSSFGGYTGQFATGGRVSVTDGMAKDIKASQQYQHPSKGGGTTDMITVNEITVTFGHGGRHIANTSLNMHTLNNAIARDVVRRPITNGRSISVDITVGGTGITYRYFTLSPTQINVGTYFLKR